MSVSLGTTNSGRIANKNGVNLEKFVQEKLRDLGYQEVDLINNSSLFERNFQKQAAVGQTLYGKDWKVDFFLRYKDVFPEDLVVECKWQSSTGSIEEKFPFLVGNIEKNQIPCIVVLDGEGYTQAAKQWIIKQAQKSHFLLHVWGMAEVQKAVNKGFFGTYL